jgi:citrate lyase beta subunit
VNTGLDRLAAELDRMLAVADAELESAYPGDPGGRQPVHTVYIPAHRFDAGSVAEWAAQALAALDEVTPAPADLGLTPALADEVLPLVRAKLAAEPVEDLRIDFEDGYGDRGDQTEDAHARAAARALAAVLASPQPPPFCGLRCKSLERPTRPRALRTLEMFFDTLAQDGRPLPPGFVVTLPKVTSVAEVEAMVLICERLGIAFEIQVETPQLVCGPDGAATLARCAHAGRGRLTSVHFGIYDYSAALGIAPDQQRLDHPAADHARAVMQAAAAGTGVRLADGSVAVLPVGGRDDVLAGWRLHSQLVRRSLERGFYQGWDLHPAQLVSRYAATYGFYRAGLRAACERLRGYRDRAAAGQEEPATARALARFVLRALDCGSASDAETTSQSGLERGQLRYVSRNGRIPE